MADTSGLVVDAVVGVVPLDASPVLRIPPAAGPTRGGRHGDRPTLST
ncbi:hypothetical protein [Cellulosimicrobium sp. CUA-896]|nr:hypothetical protein [Cellulosimicrobium sp. CUA-896]